MTKKQLEKWIEKIAFGPAFMARIEARRLLRKLTLGREGRKIKRKAVSRNDSHPSRSVRHEKPHTPWEK